MYTQSFTSTMGEHYEKILHFVCLFDVLDLSWILKLGYLYTVSYFMTSIF